MRSARCRRKSASSGTNPPAKFLLYAPTEEPDYENDWLLDIRLYSRSFRADRPSILLQQLGLLNQHLRLHIADRRKFFDAKERLQKLKALVAADDAAADLDRKMIAVVAKADQPELFNLVRTLFHAWTEAGPEVDLDNPPAVWEQVEKFDLDAPFWQMVKTVFGYSEENPVAEELPAASGADRLRPPPERRSAAGAPTAVAPPHRLVERRRLPGPMAGQQQQGQQLRPALGGSGGGPQDRRPPAGPGDRPASRRDDLPGRREADRQQPAGTGCRPRRTRSTPRTCGPSPLAGRPDIGPRPPWRGRPSSPAGAPRRLRRPGGGGGLLRPAQPAQVRASTTRTPAACTGPTSPNSFGSTNSTATSARLPTWPRRKAGASSSRSGPTWRSATSTGI